MVSGMGFCCSSYKNKTTRTFEHRGEAWRVLVGAKVVLFIESIKLFDGKLFFDIDFVAFLSHIKGLCFHFAKNFNFLNYFVWQSYRKSHEKDPDKTEKMLSGVKV